MSIANDERLAQTHRTSPHHRTARERQRLATLVYQAMASVEQVADANGTRLAADGARRVGADGARRVAADAPGSPANQGP